MRKSLLIVFLIFTFSARITLGQDQCAITLNDAEDKYEQGRLYEIPEMLQFCLADGFSREEKVRAYRLLTLTYLFLDYYQEADSAYLQLLRLAPEYTANEELDPVEIINHQKKFTTEPKYYINMGKVGVNFAYANVLTDYSISRSNNDSDKYSTAVGFHLGFGGEMVLRGNWHLIGDFLVSRRSVQLTDTHWGFYTTNMDIVHWDIEIPIMLKYNFFKGKVNPFLAGGLSSSFLVQSSILNVEGVYTQVGEEFPVQPLPQINTNELKNRFNYSVVFGGGLNYKIGLNYLMLELRYNMGMSNVTDPKMRWREDNKVGRDLKFPPGHVDDDFKINNLSLFVGLVRPLYNPRKTQ